MQALQLFLHFIKLLLIIRNLLANCCKLALRQNTLFIHLHCFGHDILPLLRGFKGEIIGDIVQMLDFGDPRGLLGGLL